MGAFLDRYLFVRHWSIQSYSIRMKVFTGLFFVLLSSIAFSTVQGTCPLYDTDFYGTDIHRIHDVSSWGTCGYFCYITSGCHYWSWHSNGDNDCILKSTMGNVYDIDHVISGD